MGTGRDKQEPPRQPLPTGTLGPGLQDFPLTERPPEPQRTPHPAQKWHTLVQSNWLGEVAGGRWAGPGRQAPKAVTRVCISCKK